MIDSGEVRWDPPPAPVPREALESFTRITKDWMNA